MAKRLINPLANLSPAQQLLLQESVHEIGLPVRTANHLEEIDVFTVQDLLNTPKSELLAISNFGEKTLQEVYDCLAKYGFYRPGHEPQTPPPGVAAKKAAEKKPTFTQPKPFKPTAAQFRKRPKPKKDGDGG